MSISASHIKNLNLLSFNRAQKINDRRFFAFSINRNFIKFFIILSFFLPFSTQANIIINEIAWMGTNVSYNDEWIELYNNGDATVSLENWILKSGDGAPEINLSGIIPGQGFFLLERTDDDTVPNVSADLIYKGALGNDGENLGLYDASGSLVDQVNSLEGWLAGDNETKETMQKINSSWQTAEGTPKKENYELRIMNYEETGSLTETRSLELKFYPKGIIFNEILPSPDGPDSENEWIEVYNENDFEVDLSQWEIKDTAGKNASYVLNKKIPALGYLVFPRPETKITLNNDGDSLNLINPNGEITDSIFFGKAFLNQSYAKTSSGWTWTTNLTPGEKNIVLVSTAKSSNQKQTFKIAEKENQVLPANSEEYQKIISLNTDTKSPPQFNIFLIAFAVALFCSIAFLIIKNNLKSFGD